MKRSGLWSAASWMGPVLALIVVAAWHAPAWSGEYDAVLKGVKRVDVVFNVSHGDAKSANVIFWAVRDVYQNEAVRALPEAPRAVVVFHGPAVKLVSTSRQGVNEGEAEAMNEFAATLKEMKKEGVKLEACMYAVKVMGVDPATLMPEIDRVGNGFVSVAGYQNQGYAVVTIP
jgi:intracellular sulfur oxidation DsrE/DsrF family protein